MKSQHEHFSGYVLAGGKSFRMGRDKAFLEINGKTFLQNAVDILTPVCEDRIKVVLNKEQTHFIEKLPKELPYIFDIYENRGPLGGIHAALKDCKTDYATIIAVDLPFIDLEFLKDLTEKMIKTRADVVSPKHENGKTEQLCSVYKRENSLPLLESLLSDQEKSVSVLNFIGKLKNAERLKLKSEDKTFDNINKPQDYRRIHSS